MSLMEDFEAFMKDILLDLLEWKKTKKVAEIDTNFIENGLELLSKECKNEHNQTRLQVAEAYINVPQDRMITEILELAIVVITKRGKKEDHELMMKTFCLLQLALNRLEEMQQVSISIPSQSCNLLLDAIATILENSNNDTNGLEDIQAVFLYLFKMSTQTFIPNFSMFKPAPNVYFTFMDRSFRGIFCKGLIGVKYHLLIKGILKVFQELQRSQLNKKKVFLVIAKTSLRNLIFYRQQLLIRSGQKELVLLLDEIICDALFDQEHLLEYQRAFVYSCALAPQVQDEEDEQEEEEGQSKKKKRRKNHKNTKRESVQLVTYQRTLFDELKLFLQDQVQKQNIELTKAIGQYMQMIMYTYTQRLRQHATKKIQDVKADIKTGKKRTATVISSVNASSSPFGFWGELCALSTKACQDKSLLSCVYKNLFEALCESDVYRVTEDTEERIHFETLEKILLTFLKQFEINTKLSQRERGQPSVVVQIENICAIVTFSAKCSPNLLQNGLIHSLQIIGFTHVDTLSHQVQPYVIESFVEIIHAYESMRLLDELLNAMMDPLLSKETFEGIYSVLTSLNTTQTNCEQAFRKAFLLLPPGQFDVIWTLFMDKIKTCLSLTNQKAQSLLTVVRVVFTFFVQEIHVTPDNRSKICTLVEKMLTQVFLSVQLSTDNSEAWNIIGELLSLFYKEVRTPKRQAQFDQVLTHFPKEVKSIEKMLAENKTNDTRTYGVGIIKICLHLMTQKTFKASTLTQISQMIVHFVVKTHNFDAISFYLTEFALFLDLSSGKELYIDVLNQYIIQSNKSSLLLEPNWYEIPLLRQVAPDAFIQVTTSVLVDILKENFPSIVATDKNNPQPLFNMVNQLIGTLATTQKKKVNVKLSGHVQNRLIKLYQLMHLMPKEYLFVEKASGLLTVSLGLHALLLMYTEKDEVDFVTSWLTQWFKQLATCEKEKQQEQLVSKWTRWYFATLLTNEIAVKQQSLLVQEVVFFCLTSGHSSTVLKQVLDAFKINASNPCTLHLLSTIVHVFASMSQQQESSSTFIKQLVLLVSTKNCLFTTSDNNDDDAMVLLTAFVEYVALTSSQSELLTQQNVLTKQLTQVLQNTTTTTTTTTKNQMAFLKTICVHFRTIHKYMDNISFEQLLTGVMKKMDALVDTQEEDEEDDNNMLQVLVLKSSTEDFQLLLNQIQQQYCMSKQSVVKSYLCLLLIVLKNERRLTQAKRQVLIENKTKLLFSILPIFQNLQDMFTDTKKTSTLYVLTLKVFVYFFCKVDAFSWKSHEISLILVGFEPLQTIYAKRHVLLNQVDTIHQIWTLSYTLLLRCIRYYFHSLSNSLPFFIETSNFLLRLLVDVSSSNQNICPQWIKREWASNLARLYGYMKEHAVSFRKHVVYLLIEFLLAASKNQLELSLQQIVRPGIFNLLDICSTFEKEQLFASLDATGKSLLKTLDTSYKRTHCYEGKV